MSTNDLANLGQASLKSFSVSSNFGSNQDPDHGGVDGIASVTDWNSFTWFMDGKGNFPATVTVSLDVSENTSGYDVSDVRSVVGFNKGVQGQQVVTVSYRGVGETAFALLGTYAYQTPGDSNFGCIHLSAEKGGCMLKGVEALRFAYALPEGTDRMVLQEIDVMGVAASPSLDLQLASVFTDDLILLRERTVPIWGSSEPGASVTVEFAGQVKTTTTAPDGSWEIALDPMPASTVVRALTVRAELGSEALERKVFGLKVL